MTDTCHATTHSGRFVCGKPAEPITAGCVHEHISTSFICGEHRRLMGNGALSCAPCFRGPDSHECRLLASREARAR
jgi:hypothetical protein